MRARLWCYGSLSEDDRLVLVQALAGEPALRESLEDVLLAKLSDPTRERFVSAFCSALELEIGPREAAGMALARTWEELDAGRRAR